MALKLTIEGPPFGSYVPPKHTIASEIHGRIREFIPGITSMDEQPFHRLKLEDDDREHTMFGGGWFDLTAGSLVTLYSFEGFNKPSGSDLDGIEVKDETGQIMVRIRKKAAMVFED